MDVRIEFQIDERVLAGTRRHGLETTDTAVIATTFYMMPVRFAIGDRELLRSRIGDWSAQPLLGLATMLYDSVARLRVSGDSECCVSGGTLRFVRQGDRVHVRSHNHIEADLAISDLELAVTRFRDGVGETMGRLVPELTTLPYWAEWFPTE